MSIELKHSSDNIISVLHKLSGTVVEFSYETITNEDRLKYGSSSIKLLTENKNPQDIINHQVEWTLKKINGFKKGAFVVDGKEISSDVNDSDYYPGWKEAVKENAYDILQAIGNLLWGEPSVVVKNDFFLDRNLTNTSGAGRQIKKKNTGKSIKTLPS